MSAFRYEFQAQTIIDEGRTTRSNIDEIKQWLKITEFPEIPEELIVLCLISCENVIENTKSTIKAYFKYKAESAEIFSGRDIDSEEMKKVSGVLRCSSIPKRLPNNTVIHFFNCKDPNYRNFEWGAAMKLAFMVLDISQRVDPPNELVVIIDMKGAGFMHLTRIKIHLVRIFLAFLQEAMPLKIKEIHILNANYIFDKLLSLARVFIKSELMSILKMYPPGTDMKKFNKEQIPSSHLPSDYGGELPSSDELNQMSIEKFRELKEYFRAEESLIDFKK